MIPQVVIIFSAGIIIFILGKNIPKIKETQEDDLLFENKSRKEKKKFSYLCGRLARRIKKESYQEKADLVWKLLEKSLRKIRIKFLKLDNKIVPVLEELKKKNESRDNESEFKKEADNNYEKPGDDENAVNAVNVVNNAEFDKSEKNKENNFGFDNLNDTAEKNISKDISNDKFDDKPQVDEVASEENKRSSKEKEHIDSILKNPMDIKAYWKLGIIYSRRKKYKDSISCFRQIIKIDPGYTKAKKKIVDLMGRMKKGKKDDKEK